jgi:transglutaminase/protease-like cytokinesis protein 3
VLALTPADETSPAAVGRFLAAREPDRWQRARAVHDYVADRIAYDVESYRRGVYPPQDAATTFRTRLSVCAGYAALFEAVGRAAGLTVETVVGRARGLVNTGMGEGHAWNAVKLDQRWYLVDTTWDAGSVGADGFRKGYKTWYFLTPPEALLATHFPDERRWQLLATPRTPGEFLRMPALSPEFFVRGLGLVSPDRAESDARGSVEVVVDNPRGMSLLVNVRPEGGGATRCELTGTTRVTVRCPLVGADLHEVALFVAAERYTTHWGVGSLRVHNR